MSHSIVDTRSAQKDSNGIWVSTALLEKDVALSKEAWEDIYKYDEEALEKDKQDFIENKLADHLHWIEPFYNFDSNTVYLEIGSGPAHIGEYLMEKYDCHFVGVDFNYQILLTLKKRFEKKGYTKFTLIHGDINSMPILSESIDFIYGGGVIEHFSNTQHILDVSYQVLRSGGVSFNTIPAFNLWWFTRPYNNIPSLPVLKLVFEWIHMQVLQGKVLKKYFGYELSYLPYQLRALHYKAGFQNILVGPFAFHPSKKVLKNASLREFYYWLSSNLLTCPVYYVVGRKE